MSNADGFPEAGSLAPAKLSPTTSADAASRSRSAPVANPLFQLLASEPEAAVLFHLSGHGPDFASAIEEASYKKLPEAIRVCSGAILEAQLAAMRANAAVADRSFRNCAIDESRAYLINEVAAFSDAVKANRSDEATRHLGSAVAALHSFYTYTDFVERLAEQKKSWSDVEGIAGNVWKPGALAVDVSTLISDHSESAHPAICKKALPQLDKSSKYQPASKVRLKDWGCTAHEAAVDLALADSGAMLKSLWKAHPTYAEACGKKGLSTSAVVAFLHAIVNLAGGNR